jgi:hypothetical protein
MRLSLYVTQNANVYFIEHFQTTSRPNKNKNIKHDYKQRKLFYFNIVLATGSILQTSLVEILTIPSFCSLVGVFVEPGCLHLQVYLTADCPRQLFFPFYT